MIRCLVQNCPNRQGKVGCEDIKFFQFPNDPELLQKWINASGVKGKINKRTAKICSSHFKEADFKLEHVLLNIPHKKRLLRKGVLPTENLPVKIYTERDARLNKRERKKVVDEAIAYFEKFSDSSNKTDTKKEKINIDLKKVERFEEFEIENLENYSFDETERSERTPSFNGDSADWLYLCHICGKEHDTINLVKNDDVDIVQIINKFLSTPIDYFDEITWNICISCKDFLIALLAFSAHFNRVQQMFLEMELLSNLNTKFSLNELRLKYGITKNFKVEKYYIDDDETENMDDSYDFMENNKNVNIKNKFEEEIIVSDIHDSKEKTSPSTKNTSQIDNSNLEHAVEHLYFQDESLSFDLSNDESNQLENVRNDFNFQKENDKNINDTDFEFDLEDKNEFQPNQFKQRKFIHCEFCQRIFNRQHKFESHLRNDHNMKNNIHSCELCGKKFHALLNLKKHQRIHLSQEEKEKLLVPCTLCDQKFVKKSTLRDHIITRHSNLKNYICEICGKLFSTSTSLSAHRIGAHRGRVRKDITGGSCPICNKICRNQMALKAHKLTHKPPSIKCSVCSALFKSNRVLKNHMMLHTGKNLYNCSFCGKGFRYKINYKLHMIIHIELKPFICRFCEQGFTNPYNCKKHEKRFHNEKCLDDANEKSIIYQYNLPTTEQLELLLVNKKLNK